jgi:hypothetical protein
MLFDECSDAAMDDYKIGALCNVIHEYFFNEGSVLLFQHTPKRKKNYKIGWLSEEKRL